MRVLFSKGIAAISKARCGSTSLRRMLDPFVDPQAGDIAANRAGQRPPFHPHITAPYLREVLDEQGHDSAALEYFVTTRHPVEMLRSYYRYFRPDEKSRYNFHPEWSGCIGMGFEDWVLKGQAGMNVNWERLAPAWVSTDDLSPLSLEARVMRCDESMAVDHVFRIEEPDKLADWVSAKAGQRVDPMHVNRSGPVRTADLGHEALDRIRHMMPMESALYGL